MRERDERVPLEGLVQVEDSGKTPFVAAIEVTVDGRPEKLRASQG